MAEWLGRVMQGWPTWVVVIAVIIGSLTILAVYIEISAAPYGEPIGDIIEKRRRDAKAKKRK